MRRARAGAGVLGARAAARRGGRAPHTGCRLHLYQGIHNIPARNQTVLGILNAKDIINQLHFTCDILLGVRNE